MSYKIVGHRGFPERYPENSLQGFEAAIEAGADAIECDIQFTQEGTPILLHDTDLERVSERPFSLNNIVDSKLSALSVHEPARFGETFFPTPIEPLSSLVSLLHKYPKVQVFVELKHESLVWVSREEALQKIRVLFVDSHVQWVLISFDFELIQIAKKNGLVCGWVLHQYDDASQKRAIDLEPDYLICNFKKIKKNYSECQVFDFEVKDNVSAYFIWPGPWQWFIYDIVDADLAEEWFQVGVSWIETWDVESLLK